MLAVLYLADTSLPTGIVLWLHRLGSGPAWLSRPLQGLLRLVAVLRKYAGDWRVLRWSISYGVIFQLLSISCAEILANGIGIQMSFMEWCVVSGVLTVVLLAPVTVAGLGLREATMVGLLGVLGVSSEAAFAAALLMLGAQMTGAVLGAVFDILAVPTAP
jgi:uncharacterized membrane protein YbhN (UPF0104 family)